MENQFQHEKYHADVSFDLLDKLTMYEITYALSHYINRRFDTIGKTADDTQITLWKISGQLSDLREVLLLEYNADVDKCPHCGR